jgi:hypothetical protein
MLRALAGNPRRVERATSGLVRLAAGSLCVLIAATWPLWMPAGAFPRVPFVRAFDDVASWLEWTCLGGLGLAAAATLLCATRPRVARWAVAVQTVTIGLLVLCDQHRLQPWVYQLVVLEIVLVGLPSPEGIAVARGVVASIYCFSAFSKLDRSYFDAGGGLIVEGLLRAVGHAGRVNADQQTLLVGLVAAGELLVGLGLCWRRSRKFAWPASIAMHVALLIALGPWGAESQAAVLLWNVCFLLQNVLLFGWAGELSAADSRAADPAAVAPEIGGKTRWPRWAIRGLAAFVILFPLAEPWGLCDVWPAWAVYATGPERLQIFVAPGDRDRLPATVRSYVQPPRFDDGLCLIRIDRWSLDACRAPLYPQNRFRLGVTLAIAEESGLDNSVVVEVESAADRFRGTRTSRRLEGRAAIAAELELDWLNGFPRR